MIRYVVDKMHVSKPDSYVRYEIRRRTETNAHWTPALVRQAENYAVKVHHDNQKMYAYVMGGSVGRRGNPSRRWTKKMGDILFGDILGGRHPRGGRSPQVKAHDRVVRKAWRTKREEDARRRRKRNPTGIEAYIQPGDRVTIVNRFGQQRTGRAVMRGPHGWVLNMGGPHGTPDIGDNENIVKVVKGRRR
jgi:hypothetical protein